MKWSDPIASCLSLKARHQEALERLGIRTLGDLLGHIPRRHEDRRRIQPIASLRVGDVTTICGAIRTIRQRRARTGKVLVEAMVEDESRELQVVWFQQPYLVEMLRPGMRVYLHGEVKLRRRLQMVAPEFEIDAAGPDEEPETAAAPSLHLRRIVPIYPTTRGLDQRQIRRWMARALESGALDGLDEGPHGALGRDGIDIAGAYRAIHFPETTEELRRARARLAFEEHFLFASHLHLRRRRFRAGGGTPFRLAPELDRKIRALFPFRFTADQDRAIAEIATDLERPAPMYRLLQGDVGTGKTAVALYALLAAVRNGRQGALLAPTEVLAEQHHRTFAGLLRQHPAVRIVLVTGSVPAAEKQQALAELETGKAHLAIGTHALIQEPVRFRALGVAVIDEQHRFGVRERARLRLKGDAPHLLVMSATPIPRSFCLTAYGDLDLSILRERPPGRSPVRTELVPPGRRARALEFAAAELERGRQAYFIYPLIEESESVDLPAAIEAHRRLREAWPRFSIGLLHGRMPAAEKEDCLRRFRDREHQALVSTVVVEVGIDVPNATVMFIEDASRFGLAQLHQLRGRVGRGSDPGTCLVGLGRAGADARARLETFARTDDGFQIAEEDLRRRGPGDFLGVRQSGWPDFRIASPLQDIERFQEVRRLAESFWESPEHRDAARRYLDRHPSLSQPLESLEMPEREAPDAPD